MSTLSEDIYEQDVITSYMQNPAYEGAVRNFKDARADIANSGENQILLREAYLLRLRTEHAIRNNPYAKAARDRYIINCNHVDLHWRNENGEKHNLMQDLWDEFTENPSLDGYGELKNIQSLWHSSMFATGAAFTRYQIRRKTNKNKVPLKLETIQTSLHDITAFDSSGKGKIKYGIEFQDKKPINYFFRKNLFEENWWNETETNVFGRITIPADEILHIFIREQPGQWLGVPFLSAVLVNLYELEDLCDAVIAKQKAAQVISYIIQNTNPIALNPIGGVTEVKENNKSKFIFKVKGTNVHYLSKGEKVEMFQGEDIGNNLGIFITSQVRAIAAAIGIPYHQLTGDLSDVDFSSLRSLMIELRQRIEYIHNFITIPLGLKPLANKFKSLAELNFNVKDAKPFFQLPRFYGVDDLKDAQADKLELTSGFGLLTKALSERNITLEELKADLRLRKSLTNEFGIDFTAKNEKTTNQAENIQPNSNSSSL